MGKKLLYFFLEKIKKSGLLVPIFAAVFYSAQQASILENITENEGLPSNYIFNVVQDHQGYIWMGSDKGLINYSDGKFTIYDSDSGLPGNYINMIVPDGKYGLLLCLSEKGLIYFDIRKKKITIHYKNFGINAPNVQIFKSPINPNFMMIATEGRKKVYAIHRDRLKTVVTTFKKINKKTGIEEYYVYDAGRKLKLFESNFNHNPNSFYNNGFLYKIEYGKGISRYKKGKLYDTINEKNGLGSNLVSGFHKATNGDLYFSSFGGGVSVLRAHNNRTVFQLLNMKARAINYQSGKYYLLSDGYVYIMNNKELLAKIFVKKDALTFYIEEDRLYLGSFSGLDEYKIINNSLQHINQYPLTVGISKIRKFRNKILFSTYGTGVFSKKESKIENHMFPAFNNIENFFQNEDSTFVITSYESGFSLLDKNLKFIKNYSKKDGLLSNNITYTYGEKDTLWVGTKNGLSAIVKGKVAKTFTTKDGFKGEAVRIIFRSQKNELWLVTNEMILKKKGNLLKPLGSLNIVGDNEDHIIKSIYWKKLNELAIVTNNKFSLINLDAIQPNTNPDPPILEKIISDGKKIEIKNEIKLNPDNFLTELHFKGVDRSFMEKTQYFYQMNGGEWVSFPLPNILQLHHLDHNNYKIRIKTLNSDGYEKIYPKEILIRVFPHFYIRWWFIFSSILMLAALSALFIYNAYQKKLKIRLQEVQFQEKLEQERKRISRDLHDNIGAYTTSLINKVDLLKLESENKIYDKKLNDIRENASYIMSLLRQTIWVLSAKEIRLDGFYDNFLSYAQKIIGKESQIKLHFLEEIENNRILDSKVAISLFRIMQEAIHNILKHSEATQAEFSIKSQKRITIIIEDNGKGITTIKNGGNGLNNMEERAEEAGYFLEIFSDKTGTMIKLTEKIENTSFYV